MGFSYLSKWTAVGEGETDERAGRWSGMRKTECGLHSIREQDGSGI